MDAADLDWLPVVGKRGWVVLTKDGRIRSRTLERQALLGAGVHAFILTTQDLKGCEMGEAFINALPRMKRLVERQEGAFIATVSRSGDVKLLAD